MRTQKSTPRCVGLVLVLAMVLIAVFGVVFIMSQTQTNTTIKIAGYEIQTDNTLLAAMFLLVVGLLGGVAGYFKHKSKKSPPSINISGSKNVVVGSHVTQKGDSSTPAASSTTASGQEVAVKEEVVIPVYRK
jgi:UDP-N-acetylmuramyl pentapeptide phosphotransferase/UDP-N-acetylglucosamine-1-phosphate transferase